MITINLGKDSVFLAALSPGLEKDYERFLVDTQIREAV